jgi:three-Cys-motif partner protein
LSDPIALLIWEQPAEQLALGLVPAGKRVIGRKRRPELRNLATRPHTRLKLDGLAEYLPRWFGIMSTKAEEAFFFDLLAGPGTYPDGMGTADGSPVIACRAAIAVQEEATRRGKTFRARLRFVEQNAETARRLKDRLLEFDGLVDYNVLEGDAIINLPALLAESLGKPTLAFIDPDGFKPTTWAMIESFARRPSITEVLLSIDAQALLRSQRARQTKALTDFSGGDWWRVHVKRDRLDVNDYLRAFSSRLHDLFPYASVQHLEFLEVHAFRAIIQICGSWVGRDLWTKAILRSRARHRLLLDISGLERREVINRAVVRLGELSSKCGLYYKDILRCLRDLPAAEDDIHQALLFLRDGRLVGWTSLLHRSAEPKPRFTFQAVWPNGLRWDGVVRSPDPLPARIDPGR